MWVKNTGIITFCHFQNSGCHNTWAGFAGKHSNGGSLQTKLSVQACKVECENTLTADCVAIDHTDDGSCYLHTSPITYASTNRYPERYPDKRVTQYQRCGQYLVYIHTYTHTYTHFYFEIRADFTCTGNRNNCIGL